MGRPITLVTGQWADLPLESLAEKTARLGFDGLELASWGDHFDVEQALSSDAYLRHQRDILERHGLKVWAISNHLVGQAICDDPIDERHKAVLPERIWGDGKPDGIRQRAAEDMKNAARAARCFGVDIVTGFTGSSIWKYLYFFPPTTQKIIDAGFRDFADRFLPILDVFEDEGVHFALEVHPTEIAYDIYTTERAIEALDGHPSFCFNFDPSHLIHQMIDPVNFIDEFAGRIVNVHVKDSRLRLNGRNSILASHLDFGDHRRGWDFVSPGRGDVDWDRILRALNRIGYQGPLSIEWEDSGMDREWGVREAIEMVRKQDFPLPNVAFDAAFSKK